MFDCVPFSVNPSLNSTITDNGAIDWELIESIDPLSLRSAGGINIMRKIAQQFLRTTTVPFEKPALVLKLLQILQVIVGYLCSCQDKYSDVLKKKENENQKLKEALSSSSESSENSTVVIGLQCPVCAKLFQSLCYLDKHILKSHQNIAQYWQNIRMPRPINQQAFYPPDYMNHNNYNNMNTMNNMNNGPIISSSASTTTAASNDLHKTLKKIQKELKHKHHHKNKQIQDWIENRISTVENKIDQLKTTMTDPLQQTAPIRTNEILLTETHQQNNHRPKNSMPLIPAQKPLTEIATSPMPAKSQQTVNHNFVLEEDSYASESGYESEDTFPNDNEKKNTQKNFVSTEVQIPSRIIRTVQQIPHNITAKNDVKTSSTSNETIFKSPMETKNDYKTELKNERKIDVKNTKSNNETKSENRNGNKIDNKDMNEIRNDADKKMKKKRKRKTKSSKIRSADILLPKNLFHSDENIEIQNNNHNEVKQGVNEQIPKKKLVPTPIQIPPSKQIVYPDNTSTSNINRSNINSVDNHNNYTNNVNHNDVPGIKVIRNPKQPIKLLPDSPTMQSSPEKPRNEEVSIGIVNRNDFSTRQQSNIKNNTSASIKPAKSNTNVFIIDSETDVTQMSTAAQMSSAKQSTKNSPQKTFETNHLKNNLDMSTIAEDSSEYDVMPSQPISNYVKKNPINSSMIPNMLSLTSMASLSSDIGSPVGKEVNFNPRPRNLEMDSDPRASPPTSFRKK
ncbi:hypothetical protein TRFO_12691 [Tritrichomonas foetus]|uniref:C2H2-type domain-containing protein n=1 Tax=Tritrichomonas foetus TaxID=1144522 RepID=A0A1J4L4U3_9EUKA|nr:hypothetical protein TRFO_12691 [Tritrichomonas foetus]|eukprot:OHT17004.1 hypothetical protein TRFO_12691 [Tritrichomonas foetus]